MYDNMNVIFTLICEYIFYLCSQRNGPHVDAYISIYVDVNNIYTYTHMCLQGKNQC